jgi:hypothetical protein
MLDTKIYGLCLERIKHQILNARTRGEDKVLLETYCTADTGEIIDILELYDLDNKTDQGLWEKLDELACTISLLLGYQMKFGYGPDGEIGLFVFFRDYTDETDLAVHGNRKMPSGLDPVKASLNGTGM